jgi:hypothetical protein
MGQGGNDASSVAKKGLKGPLQGSKGGIAFREKRGLLIFHALEI